MNALKEIAEIDKSDLYIIVAGCGRLGANLASELSQKGSREMDIDSEPSNNST